MGWTVTLAFGSPMPPTPAQAVQDYRTRILDAIDRHAEAYIDHDDPDFYLGLRAAIRIIQRTPE